MNKSEIVKRLEYTIQQKEGRLLENMKQRSSNKSKIEAVRDFKQRIQYDLIEVNHALENLKLVSDSENV